MLTAAAATASATCGTYGAFGYGTAAYPPIAPDADAKVASTSSAPGA
jgi:hypothetical protein